MRSNLMSQLEPWSRRGFLLVATLLLAACASAPPPLLPKPAPAYAAAPSASGPLAGLEAQWIDTHGDQVSGFRLLEKNSEGLKWRLALIDQASHSLDLQYYVWFGDASGQLLMARVIAAAERGVKVRMLFDDLSTMLRRMSSPELRDDLLAHIDSHPNIQIRTFNAWQQRDWLGRVAEGAADFGRLNRRMHNKQMIVDNRVAIIGGRNIGDEYFGLLAEFSFHDLDVLGVGPVARQASAVFDRYWNSDWVRAIPPGSHHPEGRVTPATLEIPEAAAAHPAMQELLAGRRSWTDDLANLGPSLALGISTVHTDSPSRAAGTHNHMPEAFRALMRSAQKEVLITNAYIIPDANFMSDLAELNGRGVKVRILTNSLASHDVPAVNAHYEDWRKPILITGTALYELRPDAAIKADFVDTPPVRTEFAGLHTKAMVIDQTRSFIGSMNLDPRSEVINSEMGVIIESPLLGAALAARMARDMTAANSWTLQLSPENSVQWKSDGPPLDQAPARSPWQRLQSWFFKLMPASYY
ncbi:phospholipase D family protein [Paucibacter sp. B2R-40]|uniref:phospholipase D-like domain-containing protein n=1 Tax=Paucibacter sp. B2R-40 TaxID=2893554 RepID=UPI0021E41EDA|nr:phospholipase D family protein [Paucibacter sp. B2R-40]MCV2355718.1 phospholipase D family protein [Paucibacter sp. B2R-40]